MLTIQRNWSPIQISLTTCHCCPQPHSCHMKWLWRNASKSKIHAPPSYLFEFEIQTKTVSVIHSECHPRTERWRTNSKFHLKFWKCIRGQWNCFQTTDTELNLCRKTKPEGRSDTISAMQNLEHKSSPQSYQVMPHIQRTWFTFQIIPKLITAAWKDSA